MGSQSRGQCINLVHTCTNFSCMKTFYSKNCISLQGKAFTLLFCKEERYWLKERRRKKIKGTKSMEINRFFIEVCFQFFHSEAPIFLH